MSRKTTNRKVAAPYAEKTRPIIVPEFDDVCDRLFQNGELSPNSQCMKLLRRCIHDDQGCYAKRAVFEDFSERLNGHRYRNLLISEIVGTWYHLNYQSMWEEYWRDRHTGNHDPAFLLRER